VIGRHVIDREQLLDAADGPRAPVVVIYEAHGEWTRPVFALIPGPEHATPQRNRASARAIAAAHRRRSIGTTRKSTLRPAPRTLARTMF
jgi:hypothetical protein